LTSAHTHTPAGVDDGGRKSTDAGDDTCVFRGCPPPRDEGKRKEIKEKKRRYLNPAADKKRKKEKKERKKTMN
jgi:hypothetical protein